ncbi:zinc transporter ZupT [Alkalicoccobacillus murimartini]|uniref:Zinc transporter ZupT n=1 Tax=Alkalicoccobacillus murimartini TaxID=171685 RepID=A0ABT9YDB0_9BACI|nr:zinc transporter ZupT [Alkalicoccobacillus murimartini]
MHMSNARWLLSVIIAFVGGLAGYFIVPFFGIEPSLEIFTAGFVAIVILRIILFRCSTSSDPPPRRENHSTLIMSYHVC